MAKHLPGIAEPKSPHLSGDLPNLACRVNSTCGTSNLNASCLFDAVYLHLCPSLPHLPHCGWPLSQRILRSLQTSHAIRLATLLSCVTPEARSSSLSLSFEFEFWLNLGPETPLDPPGPTGPLMRPVLLFCRDRPCWELEEISVAM